MSPKNLKRSQDAIKPYRFKPGQSGNPKGRPARVSFEAHVAQILDEKIPGADVTKREALARVFVDAMLKRNGAMIREYLAREWPQVQKHEVEFYGEDSNELEAAMDRFRPEEASGVPAKPNGHGEV